jgi:GPN-loop GTPase
VAPPAADTRAVPSYAGLVYCMDYVESNMDWLKEQLQPLEAGDCSNVRTHPQMPCEAWCVIKSLSLVLILAAEGCYLLFDCPGQVELFTLHDALTKMLKVMTDEWNLRCQVPLRLFICCG